MVSAAGPQPCGARPRDRASPSVWFVREGAGQARAVPRLPFAVRREPPQGSPAVDGEPGTGWTVMADGYRVLAGRLAFHGIGVGTVTRSSGTGVTVVTLPEGSAASYDVSGGAPATRETDLLRPEMTVSGPDAIFLTGGSAFGLRVADGVMAALAAAGRGVRVGAIRVPIVVGAALFDLDPDHPDPPTPEDGREAARRALAGEAGAEGRVGAGAGATVGKLLGSERAMPSGQAMVTLHTADGLGVGALVAVNAVGSVVDGRGRVLAGPLGEDGHPLDSVRLLAAGAGAGEVLGNTTIGVIVTNARLAKDRLRRVARMAHDGLARAVEPVHTSWDGDTLFAVGLGLVPVDADVVGALAARAVAAAVRRAVRLAAR
jgi:L-aminopeptidase/D-esterase-like protein